TGFRLANANAADVGSRDRPAVNPAREVWDGWRAARIPSHLLARRRGRVALGDCLLSYQVQRTVVQGCVAFVEGGCLVLIVEHVRQEIHEILAQRPRVTGVPCWRLL